MRTTRFGLVSVVVMCIAALVIAASAPDAASQTRNPAATATALRTTAQAGATRVAGTATALRATARAGATRLAGTATALKATATAVRGTLIPPATVPAEEAKAAIEAYAVNVLGTTVSVVKAEGVNGDITRNLKQTSTGSSAQSAVVKLAGKSYAATLSNGAASLSYGSGAISGDVNADVQGASLGVYSLVVSTTSLNATLALELAKQTFPGLKDLKWTSYSVSAGYAWYAKSSVSWVDPKTKQVKTLAQTAIFYVVPGASGKANVSATVGRGEFASAIKVP